MENNKRVPINYFEYHSEIMSNFSNSIDHEVEKYIKGKNLYSTYTGLNFYSNVWWEYGKWNCEVWMFKNYVTSYTFETLEEIMCKVSENFGYE